MDPIIDVIEQSFDGWAAMVARERFVKLPPNAFDGVGLGRVLGQIMQNEPMAPALNVLLDQTTVMKRR